MDPLRLPSFKQIYHLSLLAEVKHFQKAADKAGITQSTLSASIKQLEKTLGTELLQRSGRSMAFTKVGEVAAQLATTLLSQGYEFLDKLDLAANEGDLRIGLMICFNSNLAIKFLQMKHLLDPEKIEIVEKHAGDLTEAFLKGDLHAAVVPMDHRLHNYRVTELYVEGLIPLVSKKLASTEQDLLKPDQLADLPFVEVNNWSCLDMAYNNFPFLKELTHNKVSVETPEMAQAMARETKAWTLLPESFLSMQAEPSADFLKVSGFSISGKAQKISAPIVFVCDEDRLKDTSGLTAFETQFAESFVGWLEAN